MTHESYTDHIEQEKLYQFILYLTWASWQPKQKVRHCQFTILINKMVVKVGELYFRN